MSAYENIDVGKLKLKGKALDVKAGGLKKKKKHKQNYDQISQVSKNAFSTGGSCQGHDAVKETGDGCHATKGKPPRSSSDDDSSEESESEEEEVCVVCIRAKPMVKDKNPVKKNHLLMMRLPRCLQRNSWYLLLKMAMFPPTKGKSPSSSSDDSEESELEEQKPKGKVAAPVKKSAVPSAKNGNKLAKEEESSDDSESDDGSDESDNEPPKMNKMKAQPTVTNIAVKQNTKESSGDDESPRIVLTMRLQRHKA